MEKFKINANIVLDFMIENHYSEHSLSQYKRIYETMGVFCKHFFLKNAD